MRIYLLIGNFQLEASFAVSIAKLSDLYFVVSIVYKRIEALVTSIGWVNSRKVSDFSTRFRASFRSLVNQYVKNGVVLDVGCGTAEELFLFCDKSRMSVGLDINKIHLQIAKNTMKNSDKDVNLIIGDAEHLPIKEASIDVIVCSEVIEHLLNPAKAIKCMCASLSTSGTILVLTPNPKEIFVKIGRKLPKKLRILIAYFLGFSVESYTKQALHGKEEHIYMLRDPMEIRKLFENERLKTRHFSFVGLRYPLVQAFNRFPCLLKIWYRLDNFLSRSYSLQLLSRRHLVAVFTRV